ncbi:MAG: hypothetical protein U0325_05445 [Polyangiales bacterium]
MSEPFPRRNEHYILTAPRQGSLPPSPPQPVLYQWRDAALRGAAGALADAGADDVSPRCDALLREG